MKSVKNAIVDYSSCGMKDLESGIVRIIGDPGERFTEDPVRILRALKLVGQYGFKISPETEREMIAKMHLISSCSHSRLSLEFEKVLKKTSSDKTLKILHKYGFLQYFLPFFHEYWKTPECESALKLLELRNSRVEAGLHRNSLSIAVAVMVFPFVAAAMGKSSEDATIWKYYSGIEKDIKKITLGVLHPHSFSKRLIESAVSAILLQTAIHKNRPHRRVAKHPRYPHAVEVQEILKLSGML
ncbi:MAG: hypothetical protein NT118_07265 [Lentisphaerae bacterium]|nr:hypothetical protein [Lentisphaerota bacterium]